MLAQGIFPQAPFLIWLRRTQRGPDAKGLQIPWGLPLSWDRSQEGSLQDWDMAMHSQGDGRAKQEWGSAVSLELGAEGLSPGPLQVLLRAPSGEQLGFSGPRGCSWKTGYVMSITSGLAEIEPAWNLLEKAMATHSSTLAWKIPWTEEPGRLQSMGLLRVGYD